MTRLLPLLLLLCFGCGLTDIGTDLELRAGARELRYVVSGQLPEEGAPDGEIVIRYQTTADKTLEFTMAREADGILRCEFHSNSSSDAALMARLSDNARVESSLREIGARVDAITGLVLKYLGVPLVPPVEPTREQGGGP